VFSVLFLAISKLCLKQNEQSFAIKSNVLHQSLVFLFFFVNQKKQHFFFEQEVFRRVLFVFWRKYLTQIFQKKGLVFFSFDNENCFLFFFTNVQLGNIFKSFNRVFNKKTSTQITNNYLVSGCLENSHFSITKMTRWVGLQKELNCSLPN
jgi:hypothetical protein